MAIDGPALRVPSINEIRTQAQTIVEKTKVGRIVPAPESLPSGPVRIEGKYYQRAGFVPKRTIANMAEELVHLKTLDEQITKFRNDSGLLQRDVQDKLNGLSLCKPETWGELIRETLDLLIISFFAEPLFSFGTLHVQEYHLKEAVKRVNEETCVMKACTDVALRSMKEIEVLDAYQLLGRIDPTDKSHLQGFAERLLAHGAYTQAATAFGEFLANNRLSLVTRLHYLAALKGAKAFEQAEQEIAALGNPAPLELDRVDCLVGRKEFAQAKEALLKLEPKTQEVLKKLFILSVREELIKDKKRSFDTSKHHFSLLEPELFLHGKLEEATLSFWLACFSTQPLLHENNELAKTVVKQLLDSIKKLSADAKYSYLAKAIERLKNEANLIVSRRENKEFDALSESLKESLNKAKAQALQEQIDGSSDLYGLVGLKQRKEFLGTLLERFKLPAEQRQKLEAELQSISY